MALLTGFGLVMLLGLVHHFGILGIRLFTPHLDDQRNTGILSAFMGLLVLHTIEIIAYAGAYQLILSQGWFGDLEGAYNGSFYDLIYFSGINFVTLGYAEVEAEGAIRMVSMMQALGGFMIITWSATFLYSIAQDVMDGYARDRHSERSQA